MPKTGAFDDTINFSCMSELREKITALQYMRGYRDFSDTVRNLIMRAVEQEIESMGTTERYRYNHILQNTKALTVIQKQKKAEKAAAKLSLPE